MVPFLAEHLRQPVGCPLRRPGRRRPRSRRPASEVAALLGAEPSEIVFTGGGTEADNLAVKGAARGPRATAGRRRRRHDRVRAQGRARVVRPPRARGLPRDPRCRSPATGVVDLDALAAALDAGPRVVSVMLVNNEVGTIQPLAEIVAPRPSAAPARAWCTPTRCRRCRGSTSPTLAAARRPRRDLGAQVRRPEGRRRARRARRRRRSSRCIEGGGQERGLRSGTSNVAGRGRDGRRAAGHRRRACRRGRAHRRRCATGSSTACSRRCPTRSRTATARRKVAGNAHLGFRGVEAETLLVALDRAGVCAAAGSSCSSGATDPSHVLAAMGVAPDDAARRRSASASATRRPTPTSTPRSRSSPQRSRSCAPRSPAA